MASSNRRSISSSHSIPFHSSRDDAFQDMTAFTPPPDNWLSTRFPNQKKEINQEESNKLQQRKIKVPKQNQLEDPCKKYIESAEIAVKSNKSLGTDDHFKSAVCSKNLLKVCEKLMTNKEPPAAVRKSPIDTSADEDDFDAELSLMNEKSRMEFYRSKYGNRRDSRSLPASPKMDRKNQAITHNPYFTITKQQDARPESSISFLTSLFGITGARNPTQTQANLAYKYDADNTSKKEDLQSGGELSKQQQQQPSSRQMTPKPHPYREMNIFSPTSM